MKNIFVALFIFAFVFSFGCGKKTEKNSGESQSTETTQNSDQSEEKKDSKTDELGLSSGLPENFPPDLPKPKNGKAISYLNTSEGTVVNFESEDPFSEIVDLYKNTMKDKGYNEEDASMVMQEGKLYTVSYKKEEKEFNVIIAYNDEEKKTYVTVTYK